MKLDGFKIGAFGLLSWGVINTAFSLWKYGADQGMYFWFCNLSLIGGSAGLWFKRRDIILAFLSIAFLAQPPWVIDNVWRVVTGENLLGMVEFHFHPGMLLGEFLLSHYHFFVIPTLLTAYLFLPKLERDFTFHILAIAGTTIFALSYFLFPSEQNINCTHSPCIPPLEYLGGVAYSLVFPSMVLLLAALVSFVVIRITRQPLSPLFKKRWLRGYFSVLAILCAFTAYDASFKNKLPKFSCEKPFQDSSISIGCKYTTEYDAGIMMFVYTLENKKNTPLECTTKIDAIGEFQTLHDRVYLEPNQSIDIQTLLPYPNQDVSARMIASCHHLP